MSDAQNITPSDVADVASLDDGEFPNRQGKHEVAVVCPGCNQTAAIHVPDGFSDREVTFEHRHPDGTVTKGVWANPAAPTAVDPASDDVIFDPATGDYVARVPLGEAGSATESPSST